MTTGLRNDSCTGIHQYNGQISRGTAGNHVAGVLFMSRSVGNNKFALVRREITISHVYGDAFFALRFQTVEQQSIIYMVAGIPHTFAVTLQSLQLIFIQFLAVEQKPAYQCGFSVIHRTGRQQAQQIFFLVLV